MKKTMMLMLLASGLAQAQFVDGQATSGIQAQSVASIQNLKDDTQVVLEGYITGRANTRDDDEYLFSDGKNSVRIDVDDDVWQGQKVDAKTRVRIYGEIDRDLNDFEVSVKRLEIIR